jgi:hypothetical protein
MKQNEVKYKVYMFRPMIAEHSAYPPAARWFLARLREVIRSSETSVHILGGISEKMATFITTAVRTSNPTLPVCTGRTFSLKLIIIFTHNLHIM